LVGGDFDSARRDGDVGVVGIPSVIKVPGRITMIVLRTVGQDMDTLGRDDLPERVPKQNPTTEPTRVVSGPNTTETKAIKASVFSLAAPNTPSSMKATRTPINAPSSRGSTCQAG
jgi:hypothetical protein